jgi:hypothetical protein
VTSLEDVFEVSSVPHHPPDSASLQRIESVTRRVGARVNPDTFIETISLAYQQAQAEVMPDLDMPARFRNGRSYSDFISALNFAFGQLGSSVNALVIGCGRGYAGCTSAYAAEVLRDVGVEALKNVDTLELTPPILAQNAAAVVQQYDLVVTHSVAHFIPSLEAFFRFVRDRTGKVFVLGHEPNAAFWNDPQIRALRNRQRRHRRFRTTLAKLVNPSSYMAKVMNTFRAKTHKSMTTAVNEILRSQFAYQSDLTQFEIAAFVDPHLPTDSDFRIGQKGLDAALIEKQYLNGFSLLTLASSEYPSLDEDNSIRQGLAGSIFSAVFRKMVRQ